MDAVETIDVVKTMEAAEAIDVMKTAEAVEAARQKQHQQQQREK
jgi:hypothetical protein